MLTLKKGRERELPAQCHRRIKEVLMERENYFNEPTVDLNDLSLFPADIYEWTKRNPNPNVSIQCQKNPNSLDDYAKRLAKELITVLKG
jgi:hypothetical protein